MLMNRSQCVALSAGILAFVVGCTDFKPHLPQAQVQELLTTWLRDEGVSDENSGFDKGQQDSVVITKTYGYGYAPTESKAELLLSGFRYREGGEEKTYTGQAVLDLMQSRSGEWFIYRLSFVSDGGGIGSYFSPARKSERKS
jgi:hypothetical protein